MKEFDFKNYGKPLQIIGGVRNGPTAHPRTVTFKDRIVNGNRYVQMYLSKDISREWEGLKLGISDFGKSFAIYPDNNGPFKVHNGIINGINTPTINMISERIKDSIDDDGRVRGAIINNGFFFPHTGLWDIENDIG